MANPDEGLEKGAMLLLSLGEDEAAEILKHLGPKEVQKLGHAMAQLKAVKPGAAMAGPAPQRAAGPQSPRREIDRLKT